MGRIIGSLGTHGEPTGERIVNKNDSKAKGSKIGVTQSNRNNDTFDARVCTENVVVGDTTENLGCLERNISGTDGNEGCLDTVEFPTLNESVRMKGLIGKTLLISKEIEVCEKQDHHAPKCNVSQSTTSVNVQSTETVKTNVDGCINDVSEKPMPESETNKCNENDKSNQNDKQSNGGSDSTKQNKNTKKSYAKTTTSNAVKIGKPVIIDAATASMCQVGMSRGGYARVLVEIQAHKELPAKIDVLYKNSFNEVIGTKIVQVAYCWKPPCCKGCGVFGHNDEFCPKIVDSNNGIKGLGNEVEAKGEVENRKDKKQNGMNNGNNKVKQGRMIKVFSDQNRIAKDKSNEEVKSDGLNDKKINIDGKEGKNEIRSNKQKENAKEKNVNKMNSNQFEVLGNLDDETWEILDMEARGIVDVFVNQKRKPSSEEQAKWNEDMLCYFRARWDELVSNNRIDCQNNQGCNNEMEDVFTDKSGIWNVRGMGTSDKQKEIAKLILEDKLHVCAAIETRLKSSKLVKACDAAFGRWNWLSNMKFFRKGCRIIIGCNNDVVSLRNIHMTDQTVLCIIEVTNISRFFGVLDNLYSFRIISTRS
ncbi:zinc knuckle CX2CX4HX4C [Artemisia annua]|uniref:Zinc knuckle CX2CX4HX4C n=1 Tax=Artemisia annua TaxID=35608 RepID=A0A2U1LGJ4_ARTAN|nr:zinc knuckle CX2CX4HX4C [Artemisia annua]